jgi:death-on-curing protein
MMDIFFYFDIAHAKEVHDQIIIKSGGIIGTINIGLLESALEHIQNDLYYPTFEEKATHLFFSVNKFHAFNDGNKRSAIALTAYFLEINGFDFIVNQFLEQMENITVDVADNRIDKELLYEIISSILYEDDYSEELKIKLFNAKFNSLNDL